MTERINITLPSELLTALRAQAKQEHRSVSNLIALLLTELATTPRKRAQSAKAPTDA